MAELATKRVSKRIQVGLNSPPLVYLLVISWLSNSKRITCLWDIGSVIRDSCGTSFPEPFIRIGSTRLSIRVTNKKRDRVLQLESKAPIPGQGFAPGPAPNHDLGQPIGLFCRLQ